MSSHNLKSLHKTYEDFAINHPTIESDFTEAFDDVLSDAGLTYDRVSVRLKDWTSFKAKASKKLPTGEPMYPHPWADIHDLMGVRITTFHSTEIPQIVDALEDAFTVVRSVDKAAQTRVSGGFGYGSHHLILEVDARVEELNAYRGFQFEVQIRTVLQHAWAEFEHDIRYKQSTDTLDPRVDRAFTLAAGLIELADQQFDQIAAIQEPQSAPDTDVPLTAATLPGIVAMILGNRFPASRMADYQFLDNLLQAHGIDSLTKLKELLDDEAIDQLQSKLNYRYKPGQIRIIDDLLLLRYKNEHIEKTAKLGKRPAQRAQKLNRRLRTLEA